jgi:peptidoglycan/LPS O-acetylase OafA/YrhL
MSVLGQVWRSLRGSPIFGFYALVALALAGLNLLMVVLMPLGPGALPGAFAQMTHFTEPPHRIHDLTFGFLFLPGVVGILVQLWRPSKNVAGMLMALVPWVALLLAGIFASDVLRVMLFNPSYMVAAVTVVVALLHPSGQRFFRSFSRSRVDAVMLGLVVVAAVPLLVYAARNIGFQATVADDHAALGHYGFMAALSFTIIGVGLLASLRPDGWRITAWIAGLLPVLLGVSSILFPVVSRLSMPWALAAVAWGVAFVAAAERVSDAKRPPRLASRRRMRSKTVHS